MPRRKISKYKKEYCEKVIEFGRNGRSLEAFAADIGIGRSTVYEWKRKHAEFDEACEKAQTHALAFWEQIGVAGMMGTSMTKGQKFNDRIWMFFMKRRFRSQGYGDDGFGNDEGGPDGFDV